MNSFGHGRAGKNMVFEEMHKLKSRTGQEKKERLNLFFYPPISLARKSLKSHPQSSTEI